MNKKKYVISLKLGALLLTLSHPLSTWAAETCASVEVLNTECTVNSVKANLEKCEDEFISVQKVKCTGDQMNITIRASKQDYRVLLKSAPGAWGGGWTVLGQKSIPHRSTTKTLPETDHERKTSKGATVEILAKDSTPAAPKVEYAFTFSGHVDAYYSHNFNRPRPAVTGGGTSGQNNLRYYDIYNNQLVLNLAEFTIKHVRKETSFLLDLDFGKFADLNTVTATGITSGGPTFSTADEIMKHVGQAVLTYTPTGSAFLFEIGKLPTHVGLELMKAKDNWNYSRSTLFSFGGPFWHTGAHLGYAAIPSKLTVGGYLYNGWGTNFDDNFTPTYGAQLKWTPSDKLTWIYNYIGGSETALDNDFWKQVHETNISYVITPTFALATDFLYGTKKDGFAVGTDAKWYGAQVGFKWQTSPTYYLSPRVEFFRDAHGFALGGRDQTLQTYTLTNSYLLSEGLEMRIEGRLDHSNQGDRFVTENSVSANQATVLLGFLYSM